MQSHFIGFVNENSGYSINTIPFRYSDDLRSRSGTRGFAAVRVSTPTVLFSCKLLVTPTVSLAATPKVTGLLLKFLTPVLLQIYDFDSNLLNATNLANTPSFARRSEACGGK